MMDDDERDRDRSQSEQRPFRETAMLVLGLFAIADVVFYNVAFCFGDNAVVLMRRRFFLVIVVAEDERVIARNPELRQRTATGLDRPRVYDLYDLVKTYRSRVSARKARKDGSHTNGRKEHPKLDIFHLRSSTKNGIWAKGALRLHARLALIFLNSTGKNGQYHLFSSNS